MTTLLAMILASDRTHLWRELDVLFVMPSPLQISLLIFLIIVIAFIIVLCIKHYSLIRVNQQLELKNDYFINLFHNMRTPLNLLKLPLEELLSQSSGCKDETLYSVLNSNVHKLQLLSEQVISMERKSASQNINVSQCELNQLVRQIATPYRIRAEQRQLSLFFPKDSSQKVWLDKERIIPVLHYLLYFTLLHTPAGGRIQVNTYFSKKNWYIQIDDSGVGLSQRDKEQMYRILGHRKKRGLFNQTSEVGTCLQYINLVVRSHHGEMSLISEHNRGTSCMLRFPYDCKYYCKCLPHRKVVKDYVILPPDISRLKQDSFLKHSRLRLLLIEDDKDFGDYLHHLFLKYYEVVVIPDSKEGLRVIDYLCPDIVIVEYVMHTMCGDEFCRELKHNKKLSDIPLIVMSSITDNNSLANELDSIADACIFKPFDSSVLLATVNNVLKSKLLLTDNNVCRYSQGYNICNDECDLKFISRLNEEILKNISNPSFNIDKLSELLNMSRSSFFKKIKFLKGTTPSIYLLEKRMEMARQLLLNDNCSIAEVADKTGYTDSNYFSTVFKKYYGVSPKNFVSNHK